MKLTGQAEALLGIESRVFFLQSQAALRYLPNAAPLAGCQLKYLPNQLLGRNVAFSSNRTGVLVFHLKASRFKLTDAHIDTLK